MLADSMRDDDMQRCSSQWAGEKAASASQSCTTDADIVLSKQAGFAYLMYFLYICAACCSAPWAHCSASGSVYLCTCVGFVITQGCFSFLYKPQTSTIQGCVEQVERLACASAGT